MSNFATMRRGQIKTSNLGPLPSKAAPATRWHAWTLLERDENDARIKIVQRCSGCGAVRWSTYAKEQRPPIGDALCLYGVPGTWSRRVEPDTSRGELCSGPDAT
jgi:hypothetical protein